MFCAGCNTPLHSWHGFSPPRPPASDRAALRLPGLAVRQQSFHLQCVAVCEYRGLAQRAIARWVLLAAILGAGGFEVHVLAAAGHADALGCRLMRLDLILFHGDIYSDPLVGRLLATGPVHSIYLRPNAAHQTSIT